jgi:hypothetical protein
MRDPAGSEVLRDSVNTLLTSSSHPSPYPNYRKECIYPSAAVKKNVMGRYPSAVSAALRNSPHIEKDYAYFDIRLSR